jgi:hypothetical protein
MPRDFDLDLYLHLLIGEARDYRPGLLMEFQATPDLGQGQGEPAVQGPFEFVPNRRHDSIWTFLDDQSHLASRQGQPRLEVQATGTVS